MKKFVLAAVMMLSTVATFAQHEEGSLTIQPRVGVSIASLTKNDGGKARLGFTAGAELEYQVMDILSVSAGGGNGQIRLYQCAGDGQRLRGSGLSR